jgi:ABC-type Fe3+ transport system substrate-binding protein
MVLGYSGDVVIAKTRAAEAKRPYQLAYYIPRTGAPLWFDVMVIPKGAKNVDSALQWINYMQTPQVNAGITNTVFYHRQCGSTQVRETGDCQRPGHLPATGAHQQAVPAGAGTG